MMSSISCSVRYLERSAIIILANDFTNTLTNFLFFHSRFVDKEVRGVRSEAQASLASQMKDSIHNLIDRKAEGASSGLL